MCKSDKTCKYKKKILAKQQTLFLKKCSTYKSNEKRNISVSVCSNKYKLSQHSVFVTKSNVRAVIAMKLSIPSEKSIIDQSFCARSVGKNNVRRRLHER